MRAALAKNPDTMHLRITSGSPGQDKNPIQFEHRKEVHIKDTNRTEMWGIHTFAGGAWHLEFIHESPELFSYSHGSLQTLVVEEVFLTPLRALLVLDGRGGGVETNQF